MPQIDIMEKIHKEKIKYKVDDEKYAGNIHVK